MRLKITISFDEEHPLPADTSWPELAEGIRERIEDDPAGYLDMAARPLSGDPGRHERGPIHVKVVPQ